MTALSIVIPTFDTAAMTLRCCRAVLASMPHDAEVIVADDGSSDGTASLLAREVPGVRVVRLETNRGFATAANHGVAIAKGRIILLLNSDTVVEPGALRAMLAAFDADPRLGVAGARLLDDDGTPQWSGGRTPTLPWMIGVVSGAGHLARHFRPAQKHVQRDVDWVSGAAMAFRREVWSPLSERFLFYCQDIELCLEARRRGWQVRIVEEARVVHGLGGTIAGGSALRHDPEKLWSDLLTWGRAHYGRRWGARARVVLVAAAALRIAWNKLLRRDTTALVRAMRRLAQSDS
jgi:GT2 family glycosyltransferase